MYTKIFLVVKVIIHFEVFNDSFFQFYGCDLYKEAQIQSLTALTILMFYLFRAEKHTIYLVFY